MDWSSDDEGGEAIYSLICGARVIKRRWEVLKAKEFVGVDHICAVFKFE